MPGPTRGVSLPAGNAVDPRAGICKDRSSTEMAELTLEMPMLFAIHCIDKPGMMDTRKAVMPAHIEYLGTKPIKVVLSGPLVSDDGSAIVGSLFIVEAANRAAVEEFQRNDPLVHAGNLGHGRRSRVRKAPGQSRLTRWRD